MTPMTDPVLAVAVRAARRASSVIMDAARDLRRLPTFSREHGEIVIAAEKDAQNAIIATITAAFPEHTIQGERTDAAAATPEGADYRWIVDPVDGAQNFAHGFPYFAVSIALAHAGDLSHAVVLDPIRDELFTAVRGKGAQLNGTPMRVSACMRLEDALIATVMPIRRSSRLADYLPILNALAGRCGGIRRAGASALDLAQLATGRLDGFFVLSTRAAEIAAGALLVREAGGRVGDLAGSTELLRTREVIAATPGVFTALREAIVAAARPPG